MHYIFIIDQSIVLYRSLSYVCRNILDMKTASWVVLDKVSNEVLFETFSVTLVKAINTERYRVVPILEYLQQLNRQLK